MDNERSNDLELDAEVTAAASDDGETVNENETESPQTVPNEEISVQTEDTQDGEQENTQDDTQDDTQEDTESEACEESQEEISNEEAEEAAEAATDEAEATQEAELEVEDNGDYCHVCGVRRKAEDSDYCEVCTEAMKATKIPFWGWISGVVAVAASVFALVIAFLVSAPALQVYKGDTMAAQNCWYPAYEAYSEVDSLVSSVNDILGDESPFVKAGVGVKMKIFDSVAHCYSPLEAAYSADSIFSGANFNFTERNRHVKEYKQILTGYQDTYEAVADAVAAMQEGTATVEETIKAFDEAKSQEGINEVFLNYLLYNVAAYENLPAEDKIEYLEATHEAALKEKSDYSWLYSIDLARLYNEAGEKDKAVEMLDKQLEFDASSYDAASMKMRIMLSLGKTDEAGRIMQEYKSACSETDMAYELEIAYLRSTGELDKARELCTEALEVYGTSPEIYRQSALIYLAEGDYDEAYEAAYEADYVAYQIYAYSGDSSAYTSELNNTVYLCAWLCNEYGDKDSDNALYLEDIIGSFSDSELSEKVISIKNGELSLEEALTKGECDLV